MCVEVKVYIHLVGGYIIGKTYAVSANLSREERRKAAEELAWRDFPTASRVRVDSEALSHF